MRRTNLPRLSILNAVSQGHTCAEFMVADCLLEGSGVSRDAARAIPLLYNAAEKDIALTTSSFEH